MEASSTNPVASQGGDASRKEITVFFSFLLF
jgi:hypothetical protein